MYSKYLCIPLANLYTPLLSFMIASVLLLSSFNDIVYFTHKIAWYTHKSVVKHQSALRKQATYNTYVLEDEQFYLPMSVPMTDLSLFSSRLPCLSSSFSNGVNRLRSPMLWDSFTNSSLLPSFRMPWIIERRVKVLAHLPRNNTICKSNHCPIMHVHAHAILSVLFITSLYDNRLYVNVVCF